MHHIRELHPIMHKKHWQVVSNNIKVSLNKEKRMNKKTIYPCSMPKRGFMVRSIVIG